MKKRSVFAALLCSICLAVTGAVPVMADSAKVVTLGADLTDAQKNTMMNYFKADASQVQILTITNQDEIEHLSAYVPMEQIGTRTLSCAYVRPTQSGGIKVRTANLTWVTCNMIATTLSTSGVTNCEVIAACPFEVSGTGALTGIIMAYEAASGQELDSTKKELATEEMVVTGELAQEVGQNDAINIMNEAKMQIIGDNIQNADEIYNIVYNIAVNNNMSVTAEQLEQITALLAEIAQQNYDYEQMKQTLENVEANVTGENTEGSTEDVADEESILNEDLDASVLGDGVIESSTDDPTLEEQTREEAAENAGSSEGTEIPEATGDETIEWEETVPEATGEETVEGDGYAEENYAEGEAAAEDSLNTDHLSDEARALFERAKTFCRGEFEGDTAALQSEMGEGVTTTVMLDSETGASLSKLVLEAYLKILTDGPETYVPDGTEMYWTTELNMLENSLQEIFGMNENLAADILVNVPIEVNEQMYQETMAFFEVLYNEVTPEEEAYEDVAAEEGMPLEEIPQEEVPVEEIPVEEMAMEEMVVEEYVEEYVE